MELPAHLRPRSREGDGAAASGREWAYDRNSSIGRPDKALDEANARGWTVVDMKKDWKRVFPFDKD